MTAWIKYTVTLLRHTNNTQPFI